MTQRILAIDSLTVSFNGFRALDGLNFGVDYGELRFVIGPNGAGKTTLLDVITGKTKADKGSVIFDGNIDLARRSEHKVAQLGIGRKFQTPSVFPSLTVWENLVMASGFRNPTRDLLRRIRPAVAERLQGALGQIGLSEKAYKSAGVLSHGERQWLEIGMLLTQEPKLLLLDEPVAGMTRRERDHTGELLQAIGRDRAVLVVEHDMEFVRQFARKVTVLHQGKLLSEGTVEQVQQDEEVTRAYLGRTKEESAALNARRVAAAMA